MSLKSLIKTNAPFFTKLLQLYDYLYLTLKMGKSKENNPTKKQKGTFHFVPRAAKLTAQQPAGNAFAVLSFAEALEVASDWASL